MQSRSLHPTDAEHKGFGHSPTSILQRKKCFCIDENIACRCRRCIYVCPACYNYEASQCASQIWKSFCSQDRPFSSSTWSGRLFFLQKVFEFVTAASRASWYQLTIFESDFTNPNSKILVGLRPNPIFRTKIVLAAHPDGHCIRKFLEKTHSKEFRVDSHNIVSNRNYYFRFWRQKAEVSLPKNLNVIMVCFLQNFIEPWKSNDRLHGDTRPWP